MIEHFQTEDCLLRDKKVDHDINELVDKSEDYSDIIIEEVPDRTKISDVMSKSQSSRLPREMISTKPVLSLAGEDKYAKKETQGGSIPLMSLFNHVNSSEKTTYVIGCIFAFLSGALGTIHAVILAKLIEALNPYNAVDNGDE